ncbi:MAG TPA: succinyl-CoA--3-ketoacid-CoA transferase [Clostridiales bacterium]|nr:succinyl-CoA--3-ketoacid-CoA transferase [Clostridiales bacterium]
MKELSKEEKQERIAKNVARIIDEDTSLTFINLGVGIPTMVSNYVSRSDIYLMAENGMLGVGPIATGDDINPDLINAGRQPVLETKGCSYMDSAEGFGMIRGGHIDATVLGALEVDQNADVANWIVPSGKQLGVGGAMDLVGGARKVIIAMTHTSKTGPKLVKRCSLPLTAKSSASIVVTEYAVFFFENGKVTLKKIASDITTEELARITDIEYVVSEQLGTMAE